MDTHPTRSLSPGILAVAVLLWLVPGIEDSHAQGEDTRNPGATEKTTKEAPAKKGGGKSVAERATSVCIDKEIADRLSVKRKRRGVVDRLYIKQARHEFSATGGYYVSDLFSGTYVGGAAYTFHMTESTALEFSYSLTHQDADTIRAIEGGRATVLDDDFARVMFYEALLNLTPFYGKLRVGGQVMRFDMHVDLGVGGIDSQTAARVVGIAGIGFKVFLGKPVALRFDVRNRTYRQELLDEAFIVNDLALTAGLSVFLPFRN